MWSELVSFEFKFHPALCWRRLMNHCEQDVPVAAVLRVQPNPWDARKQSNRLRWPLARLAPPTPVSPSAEFVRMLSVQQRRSSGASVFSRQNNITLRSQSRDLARMECSKKARVSAKQRPAARIMKSPASSRGFIGAMFTLTWRTYD